MKILFLNPHWHESSIVTTLRRLGVAAIVCSDTRECELVLKLHAGGLTLFVGHDDDGMRLTEIIKTTPRFAHIPVILTTSKWSDNQCATHQATAMGANAYVRTPIDDKDFFTIIDLVLGTELSHGKGFSVSDELSSANFALPLADDKTRLSEVGIAPAGGLPVAGLPVMEEATRLSVPAPATDSGVGMIQIEDAAAVYGLPSPDPKVPVEGDPLQFQINLEEPSMELNIATATPMSASTSTGPEVTLADGGTTEFRIDLGEKTSAGAPIASPILATPIEPDAEGTRLTVLQDDGPSLVLGTTPLGSMPIDEPILGDDQPTRVAMSMVASDLAAMPTPQPVSNTGTYSKTSNQSEDLDADALSTMPYLGKSTVFASNMNPLGYREPMDDAVVPGGAANAPDADTLKKYLYLREQDVTALSAQLRQARERVNELETQLRHEKAVTSEFAHLAQEQDRRIHDFEKEKAVAVESVQKELEDVKFDMKRRSEKIRVMELQVKEATDATERLKERVRNDIRKIRAREKELENRLEIMKKDSEALLGAREQKIIDLKRKLDMIEFNTDLLQDQIDKERKISTGLREKLAKAAQIVRVAGGLLTPEEEAVLATGVNPNSLKEEDDRTTAA